MSGAENDAGNDAMIGAGHVAIGVGNNFEGTIGGATQKDDNTHICAENDAGNDATIGARHVAGNDAGNEAKPADADMEEVRLIICQWDAERDEEMDITTRPSTPYPRTLYDYADNNNNDDNGNDDNKDQDYDETIIVDVVGDGDSSDGDTRYYDIHTPYYDYSSWDENSQPIADAEEYGVDELDATIQIKNQPSVDGKLQCGWCGENVCPCHCEKTAGAPCDHNAKDRPQ